MHDKNLNSQLNEIKSGKNCEEWKESFCSTSFGWTCILSSLTLWIIRYWLQNFNIMGSEAAVKSRSKIQTWLSSKRTWIHDSRWLHLNSTQSWIEFNLTDSTQTWLTWLNDSKLTWLNTDSKLTWPTRLKADLIKTLTQSWLDLNSAQSWRNSYWTRLKVTWVNPDSSQNWYHQNSIWLRLDVTQSWFRLDSNSWLRFKVDLNLTWH